MRFYGMGFREVLAIPIRTFWAFNAYIDRVRAEEILAVIPAHSVAMGGDHVQGIIDGLQRSIGQPVVTEQYGIDERDKEKLKQRFGKT
jgi:hypothetical protein